MKKKSEKKNLAIGCLGLIFLIVVVMWICGVFESEKKSEVPSKPLYVDLNASVRFTGTQFVITNNDNFNWENVQLEINPGLLKSGYKLNAGLMSAGYAYTVGALQFTKSNGTRFNSILIKAQSISIYCDTPKGKGYYHGTWK